MTEEGQHGLVRNAEKDENLIVSCSTWPEPFQIWQAKEQHDGECPWCGADLETVEAEL